MYVYFFLFTYLQICATFVINGRTRIVYHFPGRNHKNYTKKYFEKDKREKN